MATPTFPNQILVARGIAEQAALMGWRVGKGKDRDGWVIPVYDLTGAVIAYHWKAYDSAARHRYRWLEDSSAQYYHIGIELRSSIANAGGLLYIVNGEPGVLTLHANGRFNVLSFFGELNAPATLVDDLKALGVECVRYFPDKDPTGQKAALKLRDRLDNSGITFDGRALPDELPNKADTNDLWQLVGFNPARFLEALNSAPCLELPADEPAPKPHARVHEAGTNDPAGEVNWPREALLWWRDVVLPALDTAAPVCKGRGKYQYRHCPNPAHADNHPSFRISYDVAADGLPICTCGVQDEHDPRGVVASWVGAPDFMTWWKAERAPLYKRARCARAESLKAAEMAVDLPAMCAITADLTVSLPYISELSLETFDKPGVYLICSELGTGKTELLKKLKNLWGDRVILGVDHRVTLTAELARRLECESQVDLFPGDQRLPSALITTLPSIVNQMDPKSGALRKIEVVLIDEVEQVLSALFSITIDRSERLRIYNTLVTVIKRAEYVICLDADAGSVAYTFLKSIREDVTVIVNQYRNTDRLMQGFASKEVLQKVLFQALETDDGVIGVACGSDKFAAKLARLCARRVGANQVMLVTGDTKHDPRVRAFLKNPDANASHFRVIIYTSAMGSGVDISTTHAAAVFGFFDRQPLTHWDMHQMLMRFRHADCYNVWVDPFEADLLTDEQTILERLLNQERGTKEAVHFDDDGNDQIKQDRLALARLQAAVTARENQSKRSVCDHFFALAVERYSVTVSSQDVSPEERQQILAEMKATGEEIAQEQEQRLLDAVPVTDKQYKQYAIRGDLTPEIEAGHVRQQIEDLFAQEITRQTIHDFDDGKGIRRINLLESLYQPQPEAVAGDRAELADHIPIGDLTHSTMKRMLLIEGLRLFCGSDHTFSRDAAPDINTINQRVGKFRDTHERDIRLYLGWRADYSRKPLALLRFMVGEVGLKIEEVGADRQRLYRERKALRKQGASKEEAKARIPAPPKRFQLNRAVLTQQEQYIAQRRARYKIP